MAFKRKSGMSLDYYAQGLVYFTCANYSDLSIKERRKIDDLIEDVGGFDSKALRALVLDVRQSTLSVSLEYYIPEYKLIKLRREFYERVYAELSK